jgi:hypothetical protein
MRYQLQFCDDACLPFSEYHDGDELNSSPTQSPCSKDSPPTFQNIDGPFSLSQRERAGALASASSCVVHLWENRSDQNPAPIQGMARYFVTTPKAFGVLMSPSTLNHQLSTFLNLPMEATPTIFMLPPNLPPVIRPADAVISDAGDPAMVPSDRPRRPVRFFSPPMNHHHSHRRTQPHVLCQSIKAQSTLIKLNQEESSVPPKKIQRARTRQNHQFIGHIRKKRRKNMRIRAQNSQLTRLSTFNSVPYLTQYVTRNTTRQPVFCFSTINYQL